MSSDPFLHASDLDSNNADTHTQLVCAGDCPAQSVQWLWPEKIPLGKVTLLIGDPGLGKTLVALDIAARASCGADWPDQDPHEISGKQSGEPPQSRSPAPCSTLILSASDDLADTIRPRLDAAGADPRRIFFPAITDLRRDFAQLRTAVDFLHDCRLIIIDPINAYVGPSDAHFQTVVSKVLAPLAQLATEKRIAVVAIAQVRKAEGAAIYRAAGSLGMVTTARAVWNICRDPKNPERRLLLPLKNNLGPPTCGLAYTIQSTGPLGAPTIDWEPAEITPVEQQAIAAALKARPQPSAERAEARDWIRQALADGPRPAADILEQGEQCGYLKRTLQRAFHELDGHTAKRGLLQGWWWSLSDQTSADADQEAPKMPDIFEGVTPYEEDVSFQEAYESNMASFLG